MRTIEIIAINRTQAERFARGYDCPAVRAFMDDWEEAGSCRFVGSDADGAEVSVLILSAKRPAASGQAPAEDD